MPQNSTFEKQALALVQRLPASNLDAQLPAIPFSLWFTQVTGEGAGVIWQLTECSEHSSGPVEIGQDLPACAEANASLPDGLKVIVAITVGTFKKGLNGDPSFFSAVVERDDQLYTVNRLRDLPTALRDPTKLPTILPQVSSPDQPQLRMRSNNTLPPATLEPASANESKEPPAPSALYKPTRISEGLLLAIAITRVMPVFPANARKMLASGPVDVQITISEEGRVIEAKAIRGHLALRSAAAEAARNWVFKPAVLNGKPVKIESTLTFIFNEPTR
ncbi:MAG: energy transducer TonB [Acidobacteria bacterium]|nr:energy transducer TonB [Acidobacteriota bacterium]